MGLRIRTNVASLQAQRNLTNSSNAMEKNITRLASGYRINRAADDAAGLAISENLRADIRGLNQARRNSNDGISLVQTAEGGLAEIQNILVRLRELSIQGASDTIGQREREFLNDEYLELKEEVERITMSTEFNGTRLLVGDPKNLSEEMGKQSNSFPLEIHVGKAYYNNADSVEAKNPVNIIRIDLSKIDALPQNDGGLAIGRSDDENGANLATKPKSQESINRVDTAIQKVAEYRAYLGSVQNRLSSTVNNLGISIENLSAAKSRIKDVDFADETAEMTQNSIMQQAGAAVLVQANQMPNLALKLLQ